MNNKIDILKELKRHSKNLKKSLSKLIENIYSNKLSPEESFSFKKDYVDQDPFICVKALVIAYITFITSQCSQIDSYLERIMQAELKDNCFSAFEKIYKGPNENYAKHKRLTFEKIKNEMSQYQKEKSMCSVETFWRFYDDIRKKIVTLFYDVFANLKKVNNSLENIFGEHFANISKWISLGDYPMMSVSLETFWEFISKSDLYYSAFCVSKVIKEDVEYYGAVTKMEKDISKVPKITNDFYQLINVAPIQISSKVRDVSYYQNYGYIFDVCLVEKVLYCVDKSKFASNAVEGVFESIKEEEESRINSITKSDDFDIDDLVKYINEDDEKKKAKKKKKNNETAVSTNIEEEINNTAMDLVNNVFSAVFDKDIEDFKLIWSANRSKIVQRIIPPFTAEWLSRIKQLGEENH